MAAVVSWTMELSWTLTRVKSRYPLSPVRGDTEDMSSHQCQRKAFCFLQHKRIRHNGCIRGWQVL